MTTLTVTANSPVAGSITWSAFQFSYLGITYSVTGGNTTLLYSYFIYANRTNYVAPIVDPITGVITGATANATLVSSATLPATLTNDDCLWFINRNGIALNVQLTDIVDGSLIVTGSIIGTSIATRTIDASNIKANTLTAAEIKASAITTDVLNISTYPPSTIPNGGMEDFNPVTFVPTTWTSGWASAGAVATYSQTGAATAVFGSTSTVMAVPASSVEGLASEAAACDATSYLSGRKLVIQVAFRTTVAAAPVSVRVYWGTTPTFTIASGLSVNTGTVPTVVEIINVDASTASATSFASLASTPTAAAGVTSLLDYWTGALANNTYLMTGQVAIPQGATWFRVVVSGGRTTYATAANYTWDEVLSQAVMYSTYIGDGVITTRVVGADAITANQIGIIGQRDPVTFQPVNGTNRVEIEPGGIYVYKRSAAGVDTMQAAVDNTTGAFIAGQLVTTGSGTGVVPGFVNSSGRVILDGTGLKGIYRDNVGVDTLKLNFDAVTGNITIAGAIQSGGTITGPLIRSAAGAPSSNRVELDSAGLRLIQRNASSVDTTVAELKTVDGSVNLTGPIISNGSLVGVTVTGSIIRTSATVGDGSASSAGVLIDVANGMRVFGASATVPHTTINNAGLAVTGGSLTGSTVRTAAAVGTGSGPSGVVIDNTGVKGYPVNSTVPNTTIDTSTGILTASGVAITGGTFSTPIITTPTVSNGTLTATVVRTSATVGDGSAASAGVRLDLTGFKGFPANSSVPNTTIDVATGTLTTIGAVDTGGTVTGRLFRTAVPATSSNRVEIDSAGLRLIKRDASNIDTTVVELKTADGSAYFVGATITNATLTGTLSVASTALLTGTLSTAAGAGNGSVAGVVLSGSGLNAYNNISSAPTVSINTDGSASFMGAVALGGISTLSGVIQTSGTVNSGMKMDSTGLSFYDTNSNRTIFFSAQSGSAELTGSFSGNSIAIARAIGSDYATNFSSSITDWAVSYQNAGWGSPAAAGTPSGYVLSVIANSAGLISGFGPVSERSVLNGEIYTQFRYSIVPDIYSQQVFAYCRGSGADSSTYAQYEISQAGSSFGGSGITLNVITGGTKTVLATLIASPVANTFYKAKLRFLGATISAKVWLATSAEPVAYNAVVQSTTIQTSGMCGVAVGWNPMFSAANFSIDWASYNVTVLSGAFNVDSTGNMFIGSSTLAGAQATGFAVSNNGTAYAVKFNRGGGQTAGTNYVTATGGGNSVLNATWTTLSYAKSAAVEDNGPIFSGSGSFTIPVTGVWNMHAITSWTSNATGIRVGRWISSGGAIVAQETVSGADTPLVNVSGLRVLNPGTVLYVQGYQSAGGSINALGHTNGLPNIATICMVA